MPQKILVLDDEENYAKMLHSLLEQHHFLVDAATKPESALKALEEKGYQLVISDYKMPVMDGAGFLQKARQLVPDLPVILVSGLMNTPELVKVANMGVTLVLEKPIDIGVFISHVKRFVQPLPEGDFHRLKNEMAMRESNAHAANEANRARTYPEGTQYLADESSAMQTFLEEIWRLSHEQAHLFIKQPAGCEFELLLCEMSRWQERPADSLTVIDVSEDIPSDITERLAGLDAKDASPIVGVCGYTNASLSQQEAWVDLMREAPEPLIFVHFLDESIFANDPPPIDPELYELIEQSLSQWPQFKGRLADLAVYAQRFLATYAEKLACPERGVFATDAITTLLSHAWPGNYRELADVIRRSVALTHEGPVTAAQLTEILHRTGVDCVHSGELPDLQTFLIAEQKALLDEWSRQTASGLEVFLDRLEVDPALVADAKSTEDLGLLYPDLLAAK